MITNALIVRWQGGFIEVEDSTSVAANGRFEAFLAVGNAPSTDEATRVAEGVLARLATASEKASVAIEPADPTDDRPYVGIFVGDEITVPDSSGTGTPQRVTSLTVTEDDNGDVTYLPEIGVP